MIFEKLSIVLLGLALFILVITALFLGVGKIMTVLYKPPPHPLWLLPSPFNKTN